MNEFQDLKSQAFKEPSTVANRPFIIKLIKVRVRDARGLSDDELLHGQGMSIASDISGVLAWNSADSGVDHDNWLNENNEPILYEVLQVSGALDAEGNTRDNWLKLFSLSENL